MSFIDFLAKYSNVLLAVITGVYAFLTFLMVLEMRSARKNQLDANLIAFPVELGLIHAQVQLQNAGPGPALDIEITISFFPLLDIDSRIWRHPSFLVGQVENFLLPGKDIEALREIAEKHEELVINLRWKNLIGHQKSKSVTYNLHALVEGWYKGGRIIPPKDMTSQLMDIDKHLEKIHEDLNRIESDLKN